MKIPVTLKYIYHTEHQDNEDLDIHQQSVLRSLNKIPINNSNPVEKYIYIKGSLDLLEVEALRQDVDTKDNQIEGTTIMFKSGLVWWVKEDFNYLFNLWSGLE